MSAATYPAVLSDDPILVESPMDRFECCEHCRSVRCPRHDGHPDPCAVVDGCVVGTTMLGEHRP